MDKIVYSVRLDVQKNALQATLHGFRVGDTASRQLNITLHQSGKTINLSEFDDVIMFVRKEGSSTPTMSLCSVEDNTIIYDVLQSDVSSEGEVEFTVRVQSGDSIAYAPKFNALVIDPECNAAVAPGTPEYSILETLTSRVEYLEERQGEMIAEGIQEFVTEHKEELQGPKGDPGETGPKGDQGEPGVQGPKGDSGVIVSVEEPPVEEGDIWINPEGIVVLDKATPTELGLVKPDGRTIFVDEDGVISARGAGTVGIATTTEAGIVKPDGATVTVDADGTLHAIGGGGGSTSVEWNAISGKPSAFTPTAHTHGKNDITDFPTEMKPSAHTHTKSDVTDFPTTMPPTAHTHTKSEITDFPSIPTVNNKTITIQKNGTNVDSFTTNASANKTINITVGKSDVGLANVDNTADSTKSVNKALLASGTDTTQGQLRNIVFTQTAPNVGEVSDLPIGTIIAVYE